MLKSCFKEIVRVFPGFVQDSRGGKKARQNKPFKLLSSDPNFGPPSKLALALKLCKRFQLKDKHTNLKGTILVNELIM